MARTGNLVSVKIVADRLMRNPLMKDMNWEFIIDNALELLRILDAPSLFVNRTEILKVKDMRVLKPQGVIRFNGIFQKVGERLIPIQAGEDLLHDEYPHMQDLPRRQDHTYSFNSRYIIFNFKEGDVLVNYQAIATDEECYPMVLDDAILLRCLESYIKYKWFDILNDMDVVSDRKLHKAETDYCFNVAQADSNLKMPTDDEMESLVNQITQLIPNNSEYSSRFEYLGSRERLRIH